MDLPPAELRFSFGSSEDTARELRAALSALKQRFGAHVAPGPVVFVGFEIGADHAAAIAGQEPAFFSRLLLIELAPSSWPSSESALFGREGGQRVLFAFGSAHRAELEQAAVLTRRGGADARAVFLGDRAPSLDAGTRALLGKHWRWLSAPPSRSDTAENLAGNALPAGGPVHGRPAQ
jgi:pimeloyl-ACP methyl ester carboxylesterase